MTTVDIDIRLADLLAVSVAVSVTEMANWTLAPFTPNVNHMAQLWLAGGSSGTSIISGPVALLLFIVVIIVFIVTVVTRRR